MSAGHSRGGEVIDEINEAATFECWGGDEMDRQTAMRMVMETRWLVPWLDTPDTPQWEMCWRRFVLAKSLVLGEKPSDPRPKTKPRVLGETQVGTVYFAQAEDGEPVKIGWSKDPQKRLATLNTSSPKRIVFIGTMRGTKDHESDLHASFERFRLNGEWFEPAAPLLDFVEGRCTDAVVRR